MVGLVSESLLQDFENVRSQYDICKKLGEGTYGLVVAAQERASGRSVAVKKIQRTDDEEQAKLLLRELKLLRHFRGHENIVHVRNVIENDGIYIVTELMDTDLHKIIQSSQPLSDEHVQYFTYQIFRGLKYLHSAKVMHRDLKPNNLLINANCDLRICDLGLARMTAEAEPRMTVYVVARWYRAPELLLGKKNYDLSIDMWAAGCILAEMLTRRPLFCGRNYIDMLQLQLALTGTPSAAEIEHLGSRARRWVQEVPATPRPDWSAMFPAPQTTTGKELVALLDQLLAFSPGNRLTAAEALRHPSMAEFHDPQDEPDCAQKFDFGFEKENVCSEQSARLPSYPSTNANLQELIRQEIAQHYTRRRAPRRRKRTPEGCNSPGPTRQEAEVGETALPKREAQS